jgi:uncharacterized protein YqeY
VGEPTAGGAGPGDSGLKARLRADLTAAMRSRDAVRLGPLRLLVTAITNREKELRRELSDDEVREVAGREVKKRTESIEAFEGAGRTDLVERERAELDVLEAYAPERLDEAAVAELIDRAIETTGASSARDVGKVMGVVMGAAKGRVDGSAVQRVVRERLGG